MVRQERQIIKDACSGLLIRHSRQNRPPSHILAEEDRVSGSQGTLGNRSFQGGLHVHDVPEKVGLLWSSFAPLWFHETPIDHRQRPVSTVLPRSMDIYVNDETRLSILDNAHHVVEVRSFTCVTATCHLIVQDCQLDGHNLR